MTDLREEEEEEEDQTNVEKVPEKQKFRQQSRENSINWSLIINRSNVVQHWLEILSRGEVHRHHEI